MSLEWSGKTVVVTGATKGIGRDTAQLFGASGAHGVVHGRSQTDAEDVAAAVCEAGGSATISLGDLRHAKTCLDLISDAVRANGSVDCLDNNAGANIFKGVREATLDDWNQCLNLDLRAAWLCAQAAVAHMPRGAAIVNVASNHAAATLAGIFPYNVAKAGLVALTQSLAIELAPLGIRANTVSPGYVDTPINTAYFATFADPVAARKKANRLHLTQRLGTPREVAEMIMFLGDSRRSGFTTGSNFVIDGGRSALLEDPQPLPMDTHEEKGSSL